MTVRTVSALVVALLVSACVQGPDYKAPQTRVADAWVGQASAGAVADGPWWRDLGDPLLNDLVEETLAANPDLREAQARLAEARANRDAVRGGRLPQVSASATGNEVVLSRNGQLPVGAIPGFARDFSLFDLGFDASWEIDLWGRQLRQNEAADARAQSAEMSLEGLRLQLVSELARAYVDLRLAQSDRDTARAVLTVREQLDGLTRLRASQGEASDIERSRASSETEAARGALNAAEAAVRAAALRVTTLAGAAPADMLARLEAPGAIPTPPAAIAAGLPSELLRRRPDIRGAERALAAATADIGVARADLFPRLSLSLALGQQARALGDLADGDSTRLQAGGGLMWPIFNGGRTRALIRAADARAEGAAARYDAAVIAALADSEGAINRFDRSIAALADARHQLGHEERAHSLTGQRLAAGEDDRLAMARADLARLAAAQQYARAQANATVAAIALHKALGGGWTPESLAAARQRPTP